MLRIPLKQGEIIRLNNREYIIETVLGDGATCIVYSAYYNDNMGLVHHVNIKECYPFNSRITRNGQVLVWEFSNEKEAAFSAFRDTYQKLMLWQNRFVANVFDIFEENQTLYIIMKADEGVTFDKDSTGKLVDIFKTVKLLAYVVGNYHNNGYLHLDIKPSNFLVYPRPSEHVVLFDMDTITAEEDIKSGKIKCVSYSQNCAAPEQKQGKLNKLCSATDIFAIGAVLFEKIIGRSVESFDLGVFSDWNFEGKLFENVNPKIKRLVRNIFKKTLSANIVRRYKEADELIEDLDEVIDTLSAGVPYVVSDYPAANINFLGRNNELGRIETAFKDSCNIVFLHGFGGIGKSELAKKYAEIHEKEYDAVLFLSYDDSIEELLENIEIINCERGEKVSNIKSLKSVLKQNRILLILDNFDVEIDQDDYLDKFLRLNADIIITTRTDFSELSIGNSRQINIDNLESKELISLFEKESRIAFNKTDRDIVDSILKRYNYYTLIVPILAKQLVASGWSLDTLNDKTKQGLKAFENTEKISLQKNGLPYRKTGLDLMRATFRMVRLSDIQKQVLINLYFLRFVSINKEEYRKYLWKENESCTAHIDAINELLYLGWLKKKHEWQNAVNAEIEIHPIIIEMIEVELQPDITKSDMLVAYIDGYLPWNDLDQELFEGTDEWGNLHTDEISHKLKWFCLFALSLDLSNANNQSFVVTSLSKLINGNIFVFQLIENWLFDKLLDKLSTSIFVDKVSKENRFRWLNLLEIKWCEASIPRIGLSDIEKNEIKEILNQLFIEAYSILGEISIDFKLKAIILLCKPAVQLLSHIILQMQFHVRFITL